MIIVFFQVAIFIIILLSAFGGKPLLIKTAITIAVFSLTTIFMPWLMVIQFCTIGIAYWVGSFFAKPSVATSKSERRITRK